MHALCVTIPLPAGAKTQSVGFFVDPDEDDADGSDFAGAVKLFCEGCVAAGAGDGIGFDDCAALSDTCAFVAPLLLALLARRFTSVARTSDGLCPVPAVV